VAAQRRDKGEGSLFFSESQGRWLGFVDAGYDATGKRRRIKVSGRTKAEARTKLAAARKTVDAGLQHDDQRTTVGEWLDGWLNQLPPSVKSVNTIDNLKWAVDLHLKPALGGRRLRDLSADDVERFLRAKAAAGLSRSSLVRLHNVLQRALRLAERRGKLARNVASLVDVPNGPVRRSRSLSIEQAHALLKAAEGERLEAMYKLGLMLGLRPGELLGLKWADVDLDDQVLRVVRTLKRERGQLLLGDPKTPTSRRALTMPAPAVAALRAHRAKQRQERLAAPVWEDNDLVFCTCVGTPLDPSNLRRGFSKLTRTAGLGHWHPHELRHSAASILSASGVPIEQIADVLGHAGTRTTAAVYRHLIEPTVRHAASTMELVFGDPDDGDSSAPNL
jgi:integrase